MELTKTEKQLVYAHRNGATINVYHHFVSSVDEATRLVNKFGKVEEIWDLGNVVSFKRIDENLEVVAFVETGRACE